MNANTDKLIDKLRKLQAKANDPNISEAEAMLYAGKVAELLQQHNLSESSLNVAEQDQNITENEFKNSKSVLPWAREVAQGVAALYFCRIYYYARQDGRIVFVGKPHNVEIAKSMCECLMKTINRLSKEYAHANRYSGEGEGKMRRQFENGAGRRVMQRLFDLRREQTREKPLRSATSNPSNLPALYEDEDTLVKSFLATKNLRKSSGRDLRGNSHTAAGSAAGNSISLSAQVSGSSRHLLGSK